MVQPLPGPLAETLSLLDHYGYPALGGLVFAEDFGLPVPGETALIAAAVSAGAGRLNVVAVGVVAAVAAIAGDNVGYLIGRLGGPPFVHRWGRYVLLTPERFRRAEAFFDRHGGAVVAGARFVEGLRQTNGIVAGAVGMPWKRFLAFNALGAALWAGVWTVVGYTAGTRIATLHRYLTRWHTFALAALAAAAAVLLVRALIRRRRRPRT
ncbi:DedA family protein [Streptomyces sp. NPDC059506]|uniref:DedA family protein n=1 Tax=unclassified Streptomyces TaxID=2593676 RepID=UPI000CC66CFC|nr:DedA family protein [Streptomyces sp. SCUT-3]PLW74162.1 alkaline phosphatase [Streptomyces sp. DJ]QMV24643.1 DedA family protein [Streptomyces sp. SCUT-3]